MFTVQREKSWYVEKGKNSRKSVTKPGTFCMLRTRSPQQFLVNAQPFSHKRLQLQRKIKTTTLHFPARAASGLQDAWCIVGVSWKTWRHGRTENVKPEAWTAATPASVSENLQYLYCAVALPATRWEVKLAKKTIGFMPCSNHRYVESCNKSHPKWIQAVSHLIKHCK